MADTFFNPIDIAISDGTGQPPEGFARLQVKSDGNLYVKSQNSEVSLVKEVFIGAPNPLPTTPALVFQEVIVDGQTVYIMGVNVP